MNNFHNRSNEQLIAEIESIKEDGLAAFSATCERLTELSRRNYRHPLHRHNLYRHHAAVTAQRLHPAIVILFDGGARHMDCFIGRPEDVQKTVAVGREFDVAIISKGEIAERKISASRMNLKTLELLFPAGKSPRTLTEQKAILQAELDAAPATHVNRQPVVRASVEDRSLIVAGTKIPLTAFKAALADLGIQLEV